LAEDRNIILCVFTAGIYYRDSSCNQANVTGTGTVWTSAHTGFKFKVSGDDEIYTFTYVSGTSGTLDKNYNGTTDTDASYTLFQDTYSLSSDFERPLSYGKKRGFYYRDGGNRFYLDPRREDEFFDKKSFTPASDPLYFWIDYENNSVIIDPPPKSARYLYYEYIPKLTRMTEYTTGTVAVTNGSAVVTGTETAFDDYVAANDYFRVDDDGVASSSHWYKIASVDSATQLTLSSAYIGTTSSGEAYTVSKAPKLASSLHLAILYSAAIVGAADQESNIVKTWIALSEEIIGNYAGNEKHERKGAQRIKTIWEKPGVFR